MSRKRPTEVSWDSDDDLLQDDLSGINAFPHSKKEETEEELDEDALLGSDDEATDKQVNTSDMCDSANADMSTSDAGNTTFGVPETVDYEFADVSQELGEDVLVIEPEVDSSLLNDTQEEGDQLEEDVDYREGEFDGGSELDSTADTQPGLDTTDGDVGADEGEGSSSESESDGEGGRARFKSERAAIVSLSQSKSRTDIPDTLEISEEQQATIDEFLTKDGRKKKQRGGFQRGDQAHALPSRGLAPGPMQPLLSNSPQRGMSSLPLGRPHHQLRPDQSHLNGSKTGVYDSPPKPAGPLIISHSLAPPASQAYRQGSVIQPIQFGLLPPPRQTFSSSPGSSQGHSAQFTGPTPILTTTTTNSGSHSQHGQPVPAGPNAEQRQRQQQQYYLGKCRSSRNACLGEVITGSSPPKVSRKTERKNVKDRLQLPSKQKQTDIQIQQQQPPPSEHPAPVIQPKEPEEALDEETRLLNEKIEEQKRLRAEIIKRKEARRLQQAKQRRLELQKKLAEQGMTLSDVDASSDNSSPQKQAHAEPDALQQPAPQKVFVPTKMAASKTGQMIATKRQGGSMGTVQTFQKEPPSKVPRQMSQPLQQGQGQMGTQPNRSGHQPGTQGRFSRQNSRGQGGFVRGQRGMRRGAVTRQMSGGNVGQTQLTPSQLQARQVKLEQSSQVFENQANRNVVSLTEQDHGRASRGHVVKGQGPVRGRGQMNRGQFGKSRGGHLPLRGRGQTVSRGQGHSVQRGPGHGVQQQTSGGQGERTVMARSMSGNNIVLGESQTTQADTAANRRVVVGPNVNKGGSSQFISIDNLSKSTTQQKLYQLCRTVGPVENVQLLQSQNKAIVKFQNPGHGHKFAQKYDRHLLDLSSIRISTLPS
ncbi:RNA-binding protein 33-like [Liolophura sinensis]|uniref:RNA-binding protein 33-like n=1 Tax=Liolophura sinensis TaxID=3198878 RepID=UPI003158ACCF